MATHDRKPLCDCVTHCGDDPRVSTGDVQACELKLAERERLLREMRLGDLLRATGYAGDTLQALQALRDLQRERQVLVRVLQACDLVLSTLEGESDAEQQSLEQLRCSIAQATLADRPQEAALLGIRLGLGQQTQPVATPTALDSAWPTLLALFNDYAMALTDAASHQSASRADIAQTSALSALKRIRKAIETLVAMPHPVAPREGAL